MFFQLVWVIMTRRGELMKTLKNASDIYNQLDDSGSIFVAGDKVSLDSVKSVLLDLTDDIQYTLKARSVNIHDKNYGSGYTKEQGEEVERHAGATVAPHSVRPMKFQDGSESKPVTFGKDKENKGKLKPMKPEEFDGEKHASVSSNDFSDLLEMAASIKSLLRSVRKSTEKEIQEEAKKKGVPPSSVAKELDKNGNYKDETYDPEDR